MKFEITDEEIRSLTQAIMTRHGIDFTCYEPKSLKRRVTRALSVFKLASIHELWVKVLQEHGFVNAFVNELSVGLTAMFRDPPFWLKLKELLPGLVEEKGTLGIWHAGCSTGEEVYTLNIVMRELGLEGRARSYASDMNTRALGQAEKGMYHIMKLSEYDHNYAKYKHDSSLDQYYTRQGKQGFMDPALTRYVKFGQDNLITDVHQTKYDIIFCRNVMIYFDGGAKRLVLDKFYENLKPGGLLVIGFFDALVPVMDKTKYDYYDLDNKIFKKIP